MLNGTKRLYFRPPKSNTAADGVFGTALKRSIHRHPTHPDESSLRLLKPNGILCALHTRLRYHHFGLKVVLATSGPSAKGFWGVYGCAFSLWFKLHYRRPRLSPAAGDIVVFSWRHPCSCHTVRHFSERTDLFCYNSYNRILRGPGETDSWKKLEA